MNDEVLSVTKLSFNQVLTLGGGPEEGAVNRSGTAANRQPHQPRIPTSRPGSSKVHYIPPVNKAAYESNAGMW